MTGTDTFEATFAALVRQFGGDPQRAYKHVIATERDPALIDLRVSSVLTTDGTHKTTVTGPPEQVAEYVRRLRELGVNISDTRED